MVRQPSGLMGKGQLLQQMVLGKVGNHMQKNEIGPYLTPLTKVNSKWIRDLNIRFEIIKLLGKNIEKKPLYVGVGKNFLNMTPKAQTTKEKFNECQYIKLKSSCNAKATIKMKRNLWN